MRIMRYNQMTCLAWFIVGFLNIRGLVSSLNSAVAIVKDRSGFSGDVLASKMPSKTLFEMIERVWSVRKKGGKWLIIGSCRFSAVLQSL